jgi:VCBS repeat-containing protein
MAIVVKKISEAGGTTVSFGNTPQANNDAYTFDETIEGSVKYLNVMVNDLGGSAKTLWSFDTDGSAGVTGLKTYAPEDLLIKDNVGVIQLSEAGAKVSITADNQLKYDVSELDLDFLGAGEYFVDTITYAIKLGNGTLSWATATVTVFGTNDGVTIAAGTDADGAVTEDADDPTLTDSGTINFNDLDVTDMHTTSVAAFVTNTLGGTLTMGAVAEDDLTAAGTVGWTYTVDNSATQYLAAGQTVTEKFTVTISDGHGGTATQVITITITGTNGVATITGDVEGDVVEDGTLTATGTLTVSDEDTGESELQPIAAGTAGTGGYGTFEVLANGQWTYTLNNLHADVQALPENETLTDTITVASEDGTDDQVITITITGTNDSDPFDFDSLVGTAIAPVTQNVTDVPGSGTFDGSNNGDTISAGNGNDTVYGHGGGDTINGDGGGDTSLYGQAGDDTINGGAGADAIYGGSGNDTIYGMQNPETTSPADAGDAIYGGSGNDTIFGQAGGDYIAGGYGADSLAGGGGNDVFAYLSKFDTGDTISDYVAINDTLDFSLIDPTGGTYDPANTGGTFALSAGSVVQANGINYFASSGNTIVQVDTDGNTATVELQITLTGVTNLTNADFIV